MWKQVHSAIGTELNAACSSSSGSPPPPCPFFPGTTASAGDAAE